MVDNEKLKQFFIENYPEIKLVDYEIVRCLLEDTLDMAKLNDLTDTNRNGAFLDSNDSQEDKSLKEKTKKRKSKTKVFLDDETKKKIYQNYKLGISTSLLAKNFDVTINTIRNIINNPKYWD